MLASLASVVHTTPVTSQSIQSAPIRPAAMLALYSPWRRLQLAPTCGDRTNSTGLGCDSNRANQGASEPVPAPGSYTSSELRMPRRTDGFRSLGGFVHLDLLASSQLRTGPEFSWSSPDSPREDLQKMRLISPGWGMRYMLPDAPVAVGVSACSRIVMMGKQLPLVDPLTSEARVEFRLP
jgi:hypothetical protein